MNILIINPPIREWAKPNCVPLGLGYIASSLRLAGHSVEVLDINAYRYSKKEVKKILERKNPDFILTGGIITVYNYLKWLTYQLKEIFHDIPIMIGGSVSTSIPDIALNTLSADIACIGEGEITAVEVANHIERKEKLSSVRGIYYREGKNIIKNKPRMPIKDMDNIAFPAYDLFSMDIYINNPVGYINKSKWDKGNVLIDVKIPKSTNINVTRGCPYRCNFCYHDYLGPGYRHRSPQNILKEMNFLNKKYGITYFLWADDESTINKEFIDEFCNLIIKSKKNYQFAITGRVNLVNEKMLNKLKAAGCNMVAYGIESGSQKILDAMNKKVTVEQAKNAIKLTKKIFGDADCSFIIGYPGETEETLKKTEEFCKELNLIPEVIFFATPYPGTKLYEYAKKIGLIKDEVEYISKLWEQGEQIVANFTNWTDEKLFKKRQDLIEELGAWNIKRHKLGDKL